MHQGLISRYPAGLPVRTRSTRQLHTSVIACPIGTVLALSLVDPSGAPGSLTLAGWALTTGLLLGPAVDVAIGGVRAIFRAEHALLVSIVIVVYFELLQGFYTPQSEPSDMRAALLAIGLFATCCAVGATLPKYRVPEVILRTVNADFRPRRIFLVILGAFGVSMMNYAIASDFSLATMISALGAGRWSAPWARGQLGGWDAFRDFLSYFGYAIPSLTVVLALRLRSWFDGRVLIGIGLSLITLVFVSQSGGRRLIVVIVGAALVTWLVSSRLTLDVRHFVAALLCLALIVIVTDAMLETRNSGWAQGEYDVGNFSGIRVDDNFFTLTETIRFIPAEQPFVTWRLPWYVIVRPIPRVFWPGKPIGYGFLLADVLNRRGVALCITAIGECWVTGGWLAIVGGGVLLGWIAGGWSQVVEHSQGVFGAPIYGLGVMALFLTVRSYTELIVMTYPLLCMMGVLALVGRRVEQRRRAA